MKILVVGAELFHVDPRTDGRTDMSQLIVAFRSYATAPKRMRQLYTYMRSRSVSHSTATFIERSRVPASAIFCSVTIVTFWR